MDDREYVCTLCRYRTWESNEFDEHLEGHEDDYEAEIQNG